MALRFPSDDLNQEQLEALKDVERITKELQGEKFSLKDAKGNYLGPYGLLAYTPSTVVGFVNYSVSYYTLPYLTLRERELSVLAVTSVTKAKYIEYAHKIIGVQAGLTQEQVDRASRGFVPKGLSEKEEDVFELALEMARGFGTLEDEVFESAVKLLSKEGVAALAQLIGGYMLVTVLEQVADVAVPTS
ncbi:hypothetical protein ACET3X_002057 [Alternaria dauci]|uniref:Carboxymuconolactone decarboxylase-like domain-containing protein n=1 Tax=Alternaria dauci TaxID=48095 RepID=A0ABR3UZF7_9PLEO